MQTLVLCGFTMLKTPELRKFGLGLNVVTLEIRRAEDIAPALGALKGRADALYVCNDPLVTANRVRINTSALGARLPTAWRENVEAGGLMSYGFSVADRYRRAAGVMVKILGGAKPADIPMEYSTQFRLIINLRTARALGIAVPQSLLIQADDVIR